MIMIYSVLYGALTTRYDGIQTANLLLTAGLLASTVYLGLLPPKSFQEPCVTFLEHGQHFANGKRSCHCEIRSMLTSICRLTQFVITKALPYIFASLGYGTWFFFASWMLLATIWAFFFLPETKGKTLDEIDIILYVQSNLIWFMFIFANCRVTVGTPRTEGNSSQGNRMATLSRKMQRYLQRINGSVPCFVLFYL